MKLPSMRFGLLINFGSEHSNSPPCDALLLTLVKLRKPIFPTFNLLYQTALPSQLLARSDVLGAFSPTAVRMGYQRVPVAP